MNTARLVKTNEDKPHTLTLTVNDVQLRFLSHSADATNLSLSPGVLRPIRFCRTFQYPRNAISVRHIVSWRDVPTASFSSKPLIPQKEEDSRLSQVLFHNRLLKFRSLLTTFLP